MYHAWLSVSSVDGKLKNTYSLWPDNHPLFQGQDPNGTKSDVRINTVLNAGLMDSDG